MELGGLAPSSVAPAGERAVGHFPPVPVLATAWWDVMSQSATAPGLEVVELPLPWRWTAVVRIAESREPDE